MNTGQQRARLNEQLKQLESHDEMTQLEGIAVEGGHLRLRLRVTTAAQREVYEVKVPARLDRTWDFKLVRTVPR